LSGWDPVTELSCFIAEGSSGLNKGMYTITRFFFLLILDLLIGIIFASFCFFVADFTFIYSFFFQEEREIVDKATLP
jgi:hypothetical protein